MKKNEKIFLLLKELVLKNFPKLSEEDASLYLKSPQSEYFNLSPLEFAKMNETNFKTVQRNIINYKFGEIMGS